MLRDVSQLLQTGSEPSGMEGAVVSRPWEGAQCRAPFPVSGDAALPALAPCSGCRAHRRLSSSGLSLGFLPARAAAAPQAAALGRLPHGPHHPCGTQAPFQGPVISCHCDRLPSCPGHGLQDALPACAGAASQAALHNRYSPAPVRGSRSWSSSRGWGQELEGRWGCPGAP